MDSGAPRTWQETSQIQFLYNFRYEFMKFTWIHLWTQSQYLILKWHRLYMYYFRESPLSATCKIYNLATMSTRYLSLQRACIRILSLCSNLMDEGWHGLTTCLNFSIFKSRSGILRFAREKRTILACPCVFWLVQRAKTCDKIWYLGPLPILHSLFKDLRAHKTFTTGWTRLVTVRLQSSSLSPSLRSCCSCLFSDNHTQSLAKGYQRR